MFWQSLIADTLWHDLVLDEDTLAVMIPIVVVVVVGIVGLVHCFLRHRERMAMIERGMHPDHPPEDELSEEPAATVTPGSPDKTPAYH